MADNNTVARPYAQAIFDVARDTGTLDELSASLETAKALLADGQVAAFLANPAMSDARRLEFLSGLFKTTAGDDSVFSGAVRQGTNFLKLLLENGRVAVLPEIADQFEELKAAVENTVDVTVTSATPLSQEQQASISAALATRLGREIRIETAIDESLIGGAVIRAGDIVIDGSVRARLEGLTNALVN
jgi:F-type H+-transporting ATPase subunit delta